MSPINAREFYDFVFAVIEWCNNFFVTVRQPMREWVQLSLPGDNVITNAIEEIINWFLDVFLGAFGDLSLLDFCFGSGLMFLLVLLLAKFFVSFRK